MSKGTAFTPSAYRRSPVRRTAPCCRRPERSRPGSHGQVFVRGVVRRSDSISPDPVPRTRNGVGPIRRALAPPCCAAHLPDASSLDFQPRRPRQSLRRVALVASGPVHEHGRNSLFHAPRLRQSRIPFPPSPGRQFPQTRYNRNRDQKRPGCRAFSICQGALFSHPKTLHSHPSTLSHSQGTTSQPCSICTETSAKSSLNPFRICERPLSHFPCMM